MNTTDHLLLALAAASVVGIALLHRAKRHVPWHRRLLAKFAR